MASAFWTQDFSRQPRAGRAMVSPTKRFRPSATTLAEARPYHAKQPRGVARSDAARAAAAQRDAARASATPAVAVPTTATMARPRKSMRGDTRAARFVRQFGDGRSAKFECEATLLHIVGTFATEVGRAAAALAAESSHAGQTEEGDVRRALARLRGICASAPPDTQQAQPLPCWALSHETSASEEKT